MMCNNIVTYITISHPPLSSLVYSSMNTVEMVYTYLLLIVCAQVERMQGRMVKDVTQDCWQRRRVEEKINSSVNILLQPVGGHNRYLSTSCVINLSADSSLSLAILHLQLTGVETVAVTISDNTTNITEYPHLFPGNNYVDYGPMDLLHLDTFSKIGHQLHPEHIFQATQPASIVVGINNWSSLSSLLLVCTAYREGDECGEEEFDCSPHDTHRHCIDSHLLCDGVPNCGVTDIPGPDETCGEEPWVFFIICLLLFLVIIFFVIFILSIINTRYHLLHPNITIPLVKIRNTEEGTENLVEE